jgi:tetratricopeptide (TPR) repeat protein
MPLIALSLVLGASSASAITDLDLGSLDPPADLTVCAEGHVWEAESAACAELRPGVLPDRELTDYAYALVAANRYEEALVVLDLLEDPQTARALNCRGFAARKLGRLEESIGYYRRAIALAPRYTPVREYLGEAYLEQGRIDLAEEQLMILETLCGTSCEEYTALAEAIAAARD